MNCAQFEWLVADVAAGRIDAGADVRTHLARCERCRAHLQAERRLTAGLRDFRATLAGAAAPAHVEQALRARFQAAHPAPVVTLATRALRRPWLRLNRLLASSALAASVLVMLGLVLAHAMREGAVLAPPALATHSHAEIATPFYPVYMTGAAVAGARGVVRVRVPRATLAVFGLPYNPRRATDPITADLVVDNGGMVTALRFVQ